MRSEMSLLVFALGASVGLPAVAQSDPDEVVVSGSENSANEIYIGTRYQGFFAECPAAWVNGTAHCLIHNTGDDTDPITNGDILIVEGGNLSDHIEMINSTDGNFEYTVGKTIFTLKPITVSLGLIIIEGFDGDDYIYGSDQSDHIYGFAGDDHIFGRGGNDVIRGAGDVLCQCSGSDLCWETGDDTCYGDTGNDDIDCYNYANGDTGTDSCVSTDSVLCENGNCP